MDEPPVTVNVNEMMLDQITALRQEIAALTERIAKLEAGSPILSEAHGSRARSHRR